MAGVYARYEQMPAPAPGVEVPPLPVLEESPKPSSAAPAWWRRRSVMAGGMAGLFLLIAIPLVWWLWDRPEGRWLREGTQHVSRAVTVATDAAVNAAGSGLRAVKERLGGTAAVAPPPEAVAAVPAARERTASRRPAPLRSKPVTPLERPGVPPAPAIFLAQAPDPWQSAALLSLTDPFLVVAEPVEDDGPIYTAADTGVVPPELLRPRLPASPPPGVRLEDLPRLEILVSATGDVESVKLLSPGAGVYSAMMLSAVKNWRFQPATARREACQVPAQHVAHAVR